MFKAEDDEEPAASAVSFTTGRVGWFDTTFSSLQIPTYRLLAAITLAWQIGFFVMITAQGLAAHDLTGTSSSVGLVTFGQGIATLLFTPLGGALADRVSKFRLFLITNLVLVASTTALAFLAFTDQLSLLSLTLNAFVWGSMFAVFIPARVALLAEVVTLELRGNALALTQVSVNGARITGPLLGAGLLAWEALGFGGVFLVITGFFVVIVLMSLKLPPPTDSTPRARPGVLTDMRLGFSYVARNRLLLALLLCSTLLAATSQPYVALLPAFTKDVLGTGNAGFGIVIGVASAGGLTVSLLVAGQADSKRAYALLTVCSFSMGAALFLTGFVPSFALLLVVVLFVGGATSGFQVLNSAIALKESSSEYLGRVQSLMLFGSSLVSIMALPVGALADAIGERTVLHLMGGGVWLISLLMLVWLKSARAHSHSDG